MTRYKTLFSYYGSKSRIAHKYPAPEYDTIVEPFAGSGAYSLRHHERQVILNDANPRIVDIWEWLLSGPPEEVIAQIPTGVEQGMSVSADLTPPNAHPGFVEFLRANCNMGTAGQAATWDKVSYFAAVHWHSVAGRLEYWLPKIQHWEVWDCEYRYLDRYLDDTPRTWFVDPPYWNPAGARYARQVYLDKPEVGYKMLALWCKRRSGQVIVCENEGAAWLPFRPLCDARSRGGVKPGKEVMWTNSLRAGS